MRSTLFGLICPDRQLVFKYSKAENVIVDLYKVEELGASNRHDQVSWNVVLTDLERVSDRATYSVYS